MTRARAGAKTVALATFLLALSALSCAHDAWTWLRAAQCGVVPVPVADLPEFLDVRARVRMTAGDLDVGFDVIARRQQEELFVVGLALPGTRLFAVRQWASTLAVEGEVRLPMRAVAAWTMDALHRGLFIESSRVAGDGAPIRWVREGEEIEERSDRDRRSRSFRRVLGARDAAAISIDYRVDSNSSMGSGYEIRNPICGYEALVVVFDPAE